MGSFLEKWQGTTIKLSPATGLLSALIDEFSDAEVLSQTASTQRCLSRHGEILEQVDDLSRLRSLHRPEPRTAVMNSTMPDNGEPLATHLLCGDLALSLNQPVSIRLTENGPLMRSDIDKEAAATIVLRGRSLETLQTRDDVSLPASCHPGESIRVGTHEFKLIRVGGR